MAKDLEINAIKYELDEQIKKYADKKLKKLYGYLPRHAGKSAKIKVNLEKLSKKRDDHFQATVVVTVPGKTLTASGNATNMAAAIDIVQSKMLSQIRRYKTETIPQLGNRTELFVGLKRRLFRDRPNER